MIDYENLLNSPKEPSILSMWFIDALSWTLPTMAAVLSVCGGVEALMHHDEGAAILGIAAGVAGAVGMIFTNWASRVRDGRLAIAFSLGSAALDMADHVDRRG